MKKFIWDNFFYKTSNNLSISNFWDFQTLRSFGENNLENGIYELNRFNEKQAYLLQYIF